MKNEELGDRRIDNKNNPIIDVSWVEAVKFCDLLTKKYMEFIPDDYIFSIPTEAQWEYVCKSGVLNSYPYQYNKSELLEIAWCRENSGRKMHPVGTKKANRWGIFDIPGNIQEWCFGIPLAYPNESQNDWIAKPIEVDYENLGYTNQLRIVRGGSWDYSFSLRQFRPSFRNWMHKEKRAYNIGFRVTLRPNQ